MIIKMIINVNCDYHHLLIMVGAQSAEDNHDYLDGSDVRYYDNHKLEHNKSAKSAQHYHD